MVSFTALTAWLLTQAHLEQWFTPWMPCYWSDIMAAAYDLMKWLYSLLRGIVENLLLVFAYFEKHGYMDLSLRSPGYFHYVLVMGTILRTADFDIMYMARSELREAFCTAITVSA